jgi:hypothetical protein
VSVILVGIHGDRVTRRLWRDSPFWEIFVAYVYQAGFDLAVTRFFYLNGVVEWGSTPGDHLFPDGGRINVVAFGWLFSGADLDFIDQWVRPFPLWGGFYCLGAQALRVGLHSPDECSGWSECGICRSTLRDKSWQLL